MGGILSICFGGHSHADRPPTGERQPLLDESGVPYDPADEVPQAIQEEEMLNRIVQQACDSFVDIASTTSRIADKLPPNSELPPTSNGMVIQVPAALPSIFNEPATVVRSELVDGTSDEGRKIQETMVRILAAVEEEYRVKYDGPIVVPLL
ncbi:hypothetical protein BC828DRAFT_384966 [Blastocladiella britannica]|nr:hypothetical protein BC828DRAFT_384966 [Blastocladiella britannica]